MYPKIFKNRDDHTATVVVMNAEQEAALPDEFRPVVVGIVGTVGTAGPAETLLLSPEYGQLMADREELEHARTEFAEHEATARRELAAEAERLKTDRANLVAGYTADKNKLDADVAQLAQDRAEFEAAKASSVPEGTPATVAAQAAAPAKRVRVAKE